MQSSGRGGNSRRGSQRREGGLLPREGKKKAEGPRFDKSRSTIYDRPKWTPPKVSAAPIPALTCAYCGKEIKDTASAVTDRETGETAHFDCILSRIGEKERLERGDTVAYIGGGRFSVLHYDNPQSPRTFRIKKILEWEDKDHRPEWRQIIADHYSIT
jgi:hypothetical protein